MYSSRCSAPINKAINKAAPPALRSIAQVSSPPSASAVMALINSSSAASSLATRRDNSRFPSASMTTQWVSDFPASTPAHNGWPTTASLLAVVPINNPADDHAVVSLHSDPNRISQLAVESSRDSGRPIYFGHHSRQRHKSHTRCPWVARSLRPAATNPLQER